MKKVLLSFFLFLIVHIGFTQTIILSEDFEQGSLPSGWTRSQASPSIGWEFGFNLGSQFFLIPSHTNYAASNDDAHDNSSGTLNNASEDRLITPMINLTSYSGSGIALEFEYFTENTYGSIGTIEVSTDGGTSWNNVFTLTPSSVWNNAVVDLSAFMPFSNINVAFRHNDLGGWASGFAVDDVIIKTVISNDGSVDQMLVNSYMPVGYTTVSAKISNQGFNTISSVLLSYTVNGGTPVQESFSGLNIPFLGDTILDFTSMANLNQGSADICVNILNVNGSVDNNPINNQNCEHTEVISSIPVKKSVLEVYTGSWAQFSPDGQVKMTDIDNNQPNTICIEIHSNDNMAIPDGNILTGAYISGYPSGTIDRYSFNGSVEFNRIQWADKCNLRNNMIVPMSVSIESQTFDSLTRELNVTVRTDIVGAMNGDLRFNLFILEDSVTGSGNGYDQVNYYNTISGHPFFGAGNPIVGFNHKKVVRQMLGGAWGTSAIIPSIVGDGESYTYTYTYTLPANFDETQIYLVGLVQEYDSVNVNNRQIINAEEVRLSLGISTGLKEPTDLSAKVYPNPFSEKIHLDFKLETLSKVRIDVYSLNGAKINSISEGYMNPGFHSVYWRGDDQYGNFVANGKYIILFNIDDAKYSFPVVLSR